MSEEMIGAAQAYEVFRLVTTAKTPWGYMMSLIANELGLALSPIGYEVFVHPPISHDTGKTSPEAGV